MADFAGSQNAQRFIRVIELKAAISCFLLGAKAENLMFQGRTAKEAYEAFCELFGYDPAELEERLLQRKAAQPSAGHVDQGTVWEQCGSDYK